MQPHRVSGASNSSVSLRQVKQWANSAGLSAASFLENQGGRHPHRLTLNGREIPIGAHKMLPATVVTQIAQACGLNTAVMACWLKNPKRKPAGFTAFA